jgi:hypothetical protein
MNNLKLYEVSILNKPESTKLVVALYRKKAEKLYLTFIGKYTATLVTNKIDCSLLINKETVIE